MSLLLVSRDIILVSVFDEILYAMYLHLRQCIICKLYFKRMSFLIAKLVSTLYLTINNYMYTVLFTFFIIIHIICHRVLQPYSFLFISRTGLQTFCDITYKKEAGEICLGISSFNMQTLVLKKNEIFFYESVNVINTDLQNVFT